ncbi:MAG: ABC transporter ATP-binding protein [Acidimicrobiia bacterium]
MLELVEIHKHYGPVRANDGITLRVEPGSIHGILGENGAGKSTLMKVLAGFITADSGEVRLDDEVLPMGSTKRSLEAGVGLLHQDPLHCMPFSVLDNFLLGSQASFLVDRATGEETLRELAERFGFALDPDVPVRTLTVGERQQLEIIRLLSMGVRVLILDEPTTAISATQRTSLFATLRTLADEGMTVLFVSHKLEEVEDLCDRVSVLRLGKLVGETELPVPTDQLVEMMFGAAITQLPRPAADTGDTQLALDGISLRDRLVTITDLSLTVAAGEVVGLAGLEGSGQQTLLRVAAGQLSPSKGTVSIAGNDVTGQGYRSFLDAGVHFLPADRLGEGLVEGLTVTEHFALVGDEPQGFVLDWDLAGSEAQRKIERFSVKGTGSSTPESLSGGNQQRLLLAMMPADIKVLLMEHPTRGLDIESAEWVWTQILARRPSGTAVVFASADLDELQRYSDRIVVFFAGRVLRILDAAETDGEEIGYLIGGKERV